MRKTITFAAAGLALVLAGCSKAERQGAAGGVKAAAEKVGEQAREAAASPEVKKVGAGIKEAAGDVAQVARDTAKGAAQGAKEGAAKVRAETPEAKDRPAK